MFYLLIFFIVDAIREIKFLQQTSHLLIPKLPFYRLLRDLSDSCCEEKDIEYLRWHRDAVEAIHEACENYIVELLGDSYLCSLHSKRITLYCKDVALARRLRGSRDIKNLSSA